MSTDGYSRLCDRDLTEEDVMAMEKVVLMAKSCTDTAVVAMEQA